MALSIDPVALKARFDPKNIRRTPPGAGRFKLKTESKPKSPVPEGLVPSLPPRRLQNHPFGDQGAIDSGIPTPPNFASFFCIDFGAPFFRLFPTGKHSQWVPGGPWAAQNRYCTILALILAPFWSPFFMKSA